MTSLEEALEAARAERDAKCGIDAVMLRASDYRRQAEEETP